MTYSATDTTDSINLTEHRVGDLRHVVGISRNLDGTGDRINGPRGRGDLGHGDASDFGGSPVSAKSVSLSASPSTTVVISPNSVVTNASGQATFAVTDPTAESVIFSAEDVTDMVAITQTATVVFQSPAPSATRRRSSPAWPLSLTTD